MPIRPIAYLHFADLAGIVTPCHLGFKCRNRSPFSGIPEMPTSTQATASLPNEPALLRIEGPVATITLNRPAAFNSIDLAIAKRLEALGAEVEASDAVRVLVIEGEGRAFCAGGDLQTIGAAVTADTITSVVGELLKHYHAFISTLRRMPKIVLASVHGSAAGAGLSLAFVADLCIATEDARFTPAYDKLGVSPDGGGTAGLAMSVGTRRALQIFLAEDSFSAAQAYQWGLVVKVVPAVELKAATRELALRLAKNAPAGLAATKALIHRAPVTPIGQQLDAERDAIIDCMHTEEFRAAVEKFTSKGK
jgi:enoyl-CoA hydratase/carnithine racemase